MNRRDLLGLAAALGAPALSRPASAQPGTRALRFIPASDLAILDPLLTTTYITRNHGYMVFDHLYGLDERLRVQPQMAEGHTVFVRLAAGFSRPDAALEDALHAQVRDRLGAFKAPRHIEFLEELPTTSSGKVSRAALRRRAAG